MITGTWKWSAISIRRLPTPVPRAGSGRLTARLDVADALPLDNIAYALLPSDEPCRVLLVTTGNWFLEKLLAADPTLHFDLLAPDAFQPEMGRNFDAVIYDNSAAASGLKSLDEVVGNALFIKASPLGTDGPLEQPPVSDTDADSPLLRLVQWRDVTFLRAERVAVPTLPGWKIEAPLRSVDHPLIIAGTRLLGNSVSAGDPRRREQRVAVFAFDVGDSDLPLRIAFPLLISNTVHWLAQTGSDTPGAVACGRSVTLASGESAQPAPDPGTTDAGGYAAPAGSKAGEGIKGSFQPLRNGFFRIDQTAGPAESHRWLAVNTDQEGESNLLSTSATATVADRFVTLKTVAGAAGGALWQGFALAAFLLLSLEWWLFHRRRTE